MAGDEPSEDAESDAGEGGGEDGEREPVPDELTDAEPTDAVPADPDPEAVETTDAEPGDTEPTDAEQADPDPEDVEPEDEEPVDRPAEEDSATDAEPNRAPADEPPPDSDDSPSSPGAGEGTSGAEARDEESDTPGGVDGDPEAESTGAPIGGADADGDSVGAGGPGPVPDLDAGTGAEGSVEPEDEAPPLSPDHETDTAVDPPAPADAEGVEPAVDDPGDAAGFDAKPDASAGSVADVDPEAAGTSGGVFGSGRSGPAEDREMPLAEHIREMLKRLAVVVAVAGLVSLLVFPFAERIINFLWYSIMPGVPSDIARPRLYGVLELLFTELKVASLAGLIVALPVLVYETYAFMRPGLYPHERRYYLAAIPTSLVLALVGVSFAYFVVLPVIFLYFLEYSQDVATIGFALGRTFDLILLLMGYMAIVFQIPLFIMLAMMMGLTSRQWLADRRLLFWGAFLGISFLFSPDPTGMAPIMVAATMIVLFEGTLLLTKWTGRG